MALILSSISATKFIGGHGTALGGVIIDSGSFDWEDGGKFPQLTEPTDCYHGVSFTKAAGAAAFTARIRAVLLRDTGASLAPLHAFLFLQGLETLSLRLERHVENTLRIVDFLRSHPLVSSVSHPSLSDHPQHDLYQRYFRRAAPPSLPLKSREVGRKRISYRQPANLFASCQCSGCKIPGHSSCQHDSRPSSMTRDEAAGITEATIRLSVGTEHIDDLIADLSQAFKEVERL